MKEYNTYNEAMAALQDGKVVSFYDNDLQITFDHNSLLGELGLSGYTFKELFIGTWVIEN